MSKISIENLRSIVFKIADVNDILLQNTNLRIIWQNNKEPIAFISQPQVITACAW
jgi:hypothetical protein